MDLQKLIENFEKGKETKEVMYLKHKNGKDYMELRFDDNDEYKDVFVYEVKEVVLNEDVTLGTSGLMYSKGTKLLVEVHYETPTMYGHDMPFKKLVDFIESNYEETTEIQSYVSNYDSEWEYIEDYL